MVGAYDASENLIAHFDYGLGLVSQVAAPNQSFYYDFNPSGSTSDLTGASGIVENSYTYDPFGSVLTASGTLSNPFTSFSLIKGETVDQDLILTGYRPYYSDLGRFTSLDPLGILGGDTNLYSYAQNNPIRLADPSGLGPIWNAIGGGLGLVSSELASTATAASFVAESGWIALSYAAIKVFDSSSELTAAVAQSLGYKYIQPINLEEEAASALAGEGFGKVIGLLSNAYDLAQTPENLLGSFDQAHTFIDALIDFYDLTLGDLFQSLAKLAANGHAVDVSASHDPNSLTGPAGYGSAGYVAPGTVFPYRIDFENAPTATAPAKRVDITDPLDPNLDWSTLQLTQVGFGNTIINIPAGSQYFQTIVPMTYNGETFDVEIEVGSDTATSRLYAHFQSIDPNTYLPPDVLTGFLPPEDGTGRGQGFVSFTVDPNPNLSTGTQIRNVAAVTFDPARRSPPTRSTKTIRPRGSIPPSRPSTPSTPARPISGQPIAGGHDLSYLSVELVGRRGPGGSGIESYTVYVSTDGGPFPLVCRGRDAYPGGLRRQQNGNTYAFFSVATDNVGNVEPTPSAAEATTTLEVPITAVATMTSVRSSEVRPARATRSLSPPRSLRPNPTPARRPARSSSRSTAPWPAPPSRWWMVSPRSPPRRSPTATMPSRRSTRARTRRSPPVPAAWPAGSPSPRRLSST